MLNGFSGPDGGLIFAARDAENYREARAAVGTALVYTDSGIHHNGKSFLVRTACCKGKIQ